MTAAQYNFPCARTSRNVASLGHSEDVLPGEVRDRPLEDLVLHLQAALVPAQLGEFLLLVAGHPGIAATIIDIGLGHPIPQT